MASNSTRVQVSRSPRHNADGFIYSLSAPSNLDNIVAVEARLRALLSSHLVGAVNSLVRLP
ncbi:hypothetical protein [Tahibacter aquaticus]|nr:hypothetical protein [Tahibacter aquaticus]